MELVCVGLSHKSAPLSVREKLVLDEVAHARVLDRIRERVTEVMIVSTCNRVEFYGSAPSSSSVEATREHLQAVITEIAGPEALPHLYERRGDEALTHLFRVASSLDSMVVGEPQILGQVKDSLELAQRLGASRAEMTKVCSAAFACAKRVRSETEIGRAAISMASAAVELATKIFGELEQKSVVLLGAGEMAELCAKHLRSAQVGEMVVASRTLERAQELASKVGGTARPFHELRALLLEADVVVCSTAALTPVVLREDVAAHLKARKSRPLFMVDLAVPRNIAPDVNELEGVYAYDVDDIQKVLAQNAAARAASAAKAEALIVEEVARFMQARALREGVPVLAQLRARAEEIARIEVERTLAGMGSGLTEKQKKSIEAMGRAIVNKLLHQPTAKLRAVGMEDIRLAGAAAELFGLQPQEGNEAPNDTPEDALQTAGKKG